MVESGTEDVGGCFLQREQGGEQIPAGSSRVGEGAWRGNSCICDPDSCSAAAPKTSVGFPLPLEGPRSKVDLPCILLEVLEHLGMES